MRTVYSIFTILVAMIGVVAQTSRSVCPKLTFTFPTTAMVPGEPSTFSVELTGNQSDKLSFMWGASAGKFVSNPWSRTTQLLAGKEDQGSNVAIFVKVNGLPEGCPNTISDIFPVAPLMIIDFPPEGFGEQTNSQIKARIDNFFIRINNNPGSEGIVALRYGEKDPDSKLTGRVRQVLDAVKFRKYDITRLSFLVPEDPSGFETLLSIVRDVSDLPVQVTGDKPYGLFKAEDLLRNPTQVLGKRVYTYHRKFK